jgi:hypothetical protein
MIYLILTSFLLSLNVILYNTSSSLYKIKYENDEEEEMDEEGIFLFLLPPNFTVYFEKNIYI